VICMAGKEYLALFDLDGTLFDTGEVNYHAYRNALQPYGVSLDREYFVRECNGRHYSEFIPVLMGTREHLEAVHKMKKAIYADHLGKARANTHLLEMIRLMRNHYYTAIVTTASRKNTMEILSYFCCKDLFDQIITNEDVTKLKPDPEGFIKAMRHFSCDGSHTIIFEDSEVGIQAARATGASVIVVNQF